MKVQATTAEDILTHHFGKKPKEVSEISGGLANFVYAATVNGDKYIVRIAEDSTRLQFFLKEQWAVEKVREKKIPVPEILEVGNEVVPLPYMIVRWVDGMPAEQAPTSKRQDIVREMGKYTALINEIPTSGYGRVFDWSSNQLSRNDSWKDFLEKEFNTARTLSLLEKHKILHSAALSKLRGALKEAAEWNYKPYLCHGDMRMKNILLNEKGKICAILDWEMCMSGTAPAWDLSIALHDLTIDEKDIFIHGYGLTQLEYRKFARGIKALNIINYAQTIEMAAAEKKEKKKAEWFDDLKTRLRGCYDLYSP